MSYLVIARKWRPQRLDEVIGQPHVTKTLVNAVRANRVAHAYLFTGPRGVGKTSVARILAKTLNCEEDAALRPCNACSNCREITQGNSVDVLEIDGASNRGIDSIRELRETVRYRPAKGHFKIYIIDEVHMLTTEAFNALLKTLEEPPEHVIFIFATTEPHKIPATILSRCQRFDFRRIPMHLIVGHLSNVAREESVEVSESLLYAIAREADGSMRDAQSLLEQVLAFSGAGLRDEELLDVLGVVDRRTVIQAGDAILGGDPRACIQVVEELYHRGIDCRRFCQHLCDHFRNVLFVSMCGKDEGVNLELPEEERDRLLEASRNTSPESLHLIFQILSKGEEDIRRSSLPKIALEMLLVRLATLPGLEPLDSLLGRLASIEDSLGKGSVCVAPEEAPPIPGSSRDSRPSSRADDHSPKPTDARTTGASKTPLDEELSVPIDGQDKGQPNDDGVPQEVGAGGREPYREGTGQTSSDPSALPLQTSGSPGDVESRWPDFLRWLQTRDPVLAVKLNESRVSSGKDGQLDLELLDVFEEAMRDAQALAKLSSAAEEFFGSPLRVAIRKKTLPGGDQGEARKSKTSKSHRKIMAMEHPVVQQAIEILGAELHEIKILETGKRREKRRGALFETEDR